MQLTSKQDIKQAFRKRSLQGLNSKDINKHDYDTMCIVYHISNLATAVGQLRQKIPDDGQTYYSCNKKDYIVTLFSCRLHSNPLIEQSHKNRHHSSHVSIMPYHMQKSRYDTIAWLCLLRISIYGHEIFALNLQIT